MPQINQLLFSHQEIATLLIKSQDIHEGHWSVSVEVRTNILNLELAGSGLFPTAVNQVTALGIQRVSEPNPLSVDAAVVNPVAMIGSSAVQ